jgi:hypothetical protein
VIQDLTHQVLERLLGTYHDREHIMKYIQINGIAVHALAVVSSAQQRQLREGRPGNASYDYVGNSTLNFLHSPPDYPTVIGGGTAGLAIGSRLSLFSSVAVIEAGGLYAQDNGNASIVHTSGSLCPSSQKPRNTRTNL